MHAPSASVTMPAMDTVAGNIFLIGLMGAGKTTLGKQLALQLGRVFYDSDQVICARTGVDIPTIFEVEGEAGFRAREAAVIDELTRQSEIVLATGGGAVLQPTNREALCTRGCVVYLHALPELLLMRTQYDKSRPLLQVADPLAKLQDLYAQRDPIYRAAARYVIDVNDQYAQQTVSRIIKTLYPEPTSCTR